VGLVGGVCLADFGNKVRNVYEKEELLKYNIEYIGVGVC